MTKIKEVELLDKTIKAFGRDSYIGPWLADVRSEVTAAISNDVALPSLNELYQARREAAEIVAAAKAEATEIREAADRHAKITRDAAFDAAAAHKQRAREAIYALAGKL